MNIILLGPQGSGKGTQAELIAREYNLVHIDMGDSLREIAKQPTELGKKIFQIQNVAKTLVPDEITLEILKLKVSSVPMDQGIIFDGVPRTVAQAQGVEKILQSLGRKVDALLFVTISEAESIARIAKRGMCQQCHSTFIFGEAVKAENDPCPKCGGNVIRRADDTPEGVKKRLAIYHTETLPVLEYFERQGKLLKINGDEPVPVVFGSMKKALAPFM